MQKNLCKVLSCFLAIIMVLGMIPMTVFADEVQAASNSDLPTAMEGLSIAYPYNTETVQQTGNVPNRFDALTFESARNEVESAQMILTPSFNVTSFELTMNSLQNEKGNIIPGWAFDVYTQHYVSIEGAGNGANYSSQYNMYSPKTGESVANGRYPDALIPQAEAITAGENTITAGQNQGIWVNLNVQNAAPGTYTGYATLTVNGTATQIPVSVRIYDVVVPEEVHQKTGMLIWWDQLQAGEGYIDRALADTYFDYIVSKRLSPMDAWNYTRYDDALAEYAASYLAVAPEISAYCLPHTSNADGTVNEEALRTTLTTLINKNLELAASGSNTDLFKKAYFYIYDEPYGDSEYAISNQITATLESVKNELAPMLAAYPSIQESFLNLKHIVTAPNPADKTYRRLGSWPNYSFANDDHGNTPLTGDSYIYAPQYQWLNTESQRALYENEEELWWYGCCHPVQPYPTYHINGSLISARAVSWMMQDYGIDGYVYSSVNYWGNYEGDSIVQMDYWNKYTSGTPGDMLLVYPGSSYGVYGPIGTIRLENIREGNEDYEYLWMLRNVYGISDISAYTKGLYEGVIVTGTYDGHTVDPDGDGNTDANAIHHANRIALLAKLEQLNVAANGATEIQPGQEGFVRGESFNSAVSTTINLDNNQEVAAIQFDYKITSGNTMKMALLPNWSSYYGYFSFGANGLDADGVYCQTLDDGYIRAVLVLDELTIMHEDPSNVITMLYMNGTGDAVGYMDDIQVLYEVPELPEVEEPTEPPVTEPEEPVEVTYAISSGLEIDVTDGTYDYISFEYQITNDGEMNICALSPDWGKYYGYYSFNANGKVWEDAGIYAKTLSDGFVRVILKTSELERTNNAYNLDNAPETVGLLLVGGNSATGTIRNVKLECGHIYESVVTEPTTEAQGYTTHTCGVCGHSYVDSYVDPVQPEEPVEVTYAISSGLEINVTDGTYDYISFEYQITNDGEMNICALSPDWGKYYGYYSFNANGKVWEDAGIYAKALSDGFVRVILKTSELERTNNAYNLDNAPETIGLLLVGSNSATGTIRNVKLECGHIYESVVTEPTTEAQGYTTHTCGVCGHSYADSYVDPIQPEEPVSYEISTGLEIDVTDGAYDYISFEYQITNGGELSICALSPDWGKYYGYYSFNANGKVWEDNGVYCESLGDGFYRVTLKTAELERTNNAYNLDNAPETVGLLFVGGSNTATGTIRNVKYGTGSVVPEIPEDALVITTGMELDVADGTYSEISFEYKVTNDGVLHIGALSPDWGKYYGYYEFDASGKVWEDKGVYCELLDNGFYRVTLKTAEMDRTNNAANTDNKPETIGLLYIGGNNTATGYIRNVQVVENVEEELPQGYWVLSEDKNVNMTLSEDLYVDLNGHNLTGTINTNGFKVYGMDAATNKYTCETLGYFSCVDAEGNAIVPENNVKTDLSGDVMRYMTIATDNGYTFHRFYVGITKQSLAPAVTGVGYKAEFYADEMVQAQVSNIGYDLWLEGGNTVSRSAAFKNTLTLRVKNYDVANYGETNLYATVWMTIGDEVITSSEYSLTLREMVETVNAQWAAYSAEQKTAVQAMVNANLAAMASWEIENIINWADAKVVVEYTFSGDEADRAGYAEGTATVSEAVAGETYGFYWADANGKLAGYRSLGTVTIPEGQTSASITIGENITIPAQADRLVAVLENSGDVVGAYTLGAKENDAQLVKKFAVISDVHTNYNQGEQFLLNGLKQFEAEGVEYVIISGDIGESDSDYAKYVSAVENSNFSGVIMASIGNHDQTVVGNANFKRYAIYDGATKTWVGIDNAPAYFADTYAGDLDITVSLAGENLAYYFAAIDDNAFIFMDQELGATGGTTTQDNFSKKQLNFVEEKLYAYSATHNLFIVEHAPIEQLKVGDKFVPGYGGCIQLNFNYPNNQRFLELLQEYTEAIWLSGHTHVQYDVGIMYVDKYYDAEGNLTDTPIAHSVHVSSLAQPRWYEGKNMIMQNDFSAASQGYVCYQYADDLAIEARSFKDYTPDSTSFDASLFINEVNAIYSMMIPLETKTHDAPTALVDLAVAANGVKRQGNVSFADTAEGLQVTFEAAGNRFEIKTGNQVKAYNSGYYLQFKIKTDLTSITLGGCNYAGSRYTSMVLDLTTAGENYTVIDMGDGWKFVQIPFKALGYVEYLPEFAIRFYNTNAAGTFTLKDMFIEPFDYSFMRGETFAGGVNKTIDLSETATNEISFEYRIMDGETMRFAFLQDWSSYFGYYLFNAAGEAEDYAGITTELMADGYVKVTAIISEMNYIHSDATNVTMLYISGGDAGGYIDNIQIKAAPQEPETPVYRGQEIVVGQDLSVMAEQAANYSQVVLDMIVPAEGGENEIGIALLDTNWNYYGYFYLEKTGLENPYAGVSAEQLSDGYWRITINIDEIDSSRTHGDVGDIERVYINNHTTGGYIDNVQFISSDVPEEPAIPEDAMEIATGMSLNVEAGAYEEISFEYKLTNDGVLYIGALSPDWGKYYGYYEFNTNGKVWEDQGVYCELLDNGFYRVTLKTAELERTNNSYNTDNAPEIIGLLLVGGSNTATGYIRNIQLTEAAQPTAVDYAVAENGVIRAGSVSYTDTNEGLQVTFAAAGNRFEIKCGDQSAAASGTLRFKIKTDLTSIKLGGCNYSGGRKTTVTVNLTASGDGFTVTDLGDGWVLVEVPMSVIGVADYLAEFAIRFYDTNAAGIFYLKDMNFVA